MTRPTKDRVTVIIERYTPAEDGDRIKVEMSGQDWTSDGGIKSLVSGVAAHAYAKWEQVTS